MNENREISAGARTKRFDWRLLLLVSLLIVAPSICIISILLLGSSNCFSIRDNVYFKLPPNAQDIREHSSQLSRSCTLWIRFQMSPRDLESFVSTTFIRMPLSSAKLPQSIGGISLLQDQTGWELDPITSFLAGEAMGTGERYLDEQMIFVDTSNPDQYIVYLTTKVNWI